MSLTQPRPAGNCHVRNSVAGSEGHRDRFESSQGEEKNRESLCGDMEAHEALEALGLRMVGGGQGSHSQPATPRAGHGSAGY